MIHDHKHILSNSTGHDVVTLKVDDAGKLLFHMLCSEADERIIDLTFQVGLLSIPAISQFGIVAFAADGPLDYGPLGEDVPFFSLHEHAEGDFNFDGIVDGLDLGQALSSGVDIGKVLSGWGGTADGRTPIIQSVLFESDSPVVSSAKYVVPGGLSNPTKLAWSGRTSARVRIGVGSGCRAELVIVAALGEQPVL